MTPIAGRRFGEILKRFRLDAAMSQETLATRAGISVESVSTLERGKHTLPRLKTVSLLADALSLNPQHRAMLLAAARPANEAPRAAQDTEIGAGREACAGFTEDARGFPPAPTPLLGREHEEASVSHLLRKERTQLLTLTGPGGVGKTRLAVQVALGISHTFRDGVCFVALAPLHDPELVLPTIARVLGLRESDGMPLAEALATTLRSRQLLVVLDNCEHLPAAAPAIGALLARCPGLRVLATSRAPLHLRGEQEYALRPLQTPPARQQAAFDEPAGYAAVRLFVQRAQAVQPDFKLDDQNVAEVSEICRRLDGLPLAIELAVPYLKLFRPEDLLARLSRRLSVLTGGACDLPVRQQTLRATLDWSYELLGAESQRLLAWLGVFEGGATLAAIEAVCGDPGQLDVLSTLRSLLEHSLLVRQDAGEELRFGMLETVREYACDRLAARGDDASIRRAHALYYLQLSEAAGVQLRGGEQATWLRRLEAERDNLRAALAWSLENGETEIALRLSAPLEGFWSVRGYLSEGQSWLEDALSRPLTQPGGGTTTGPALARARALASAAALAIALGEHGRAAAQYEESLRLCRQVNDQIGCAMALNGLGYVAQLERQYEHAIALHEESLAIARATADRAGMARALNNLGLVAQVQGRYEQAVALHEESLSLKEVLGHERGIAVSMHNLGEVALLRGDFESAVRYFTESVARKQRLGSNEGMSVSLDGLAAVAAALGQPDRAARLLGAAAALRTALGTPQKLAVRPLYEPTVAAVRAALGDQGFVNAWQTGEGRPMADIIAEVRNIRTSTPRGENPGLSAGR